MTKTCIVPTCRNSSTWLSSKIFIRVPESYEIRKKWFTAANRSITEYGLKSSVYFCEDHFDLPSDSYNWQEYLKKKCQIRIKKNIIPKVKPGIKRTFTFNEETDNNNKRQCLEVQFLSSPVEYENIAFLPKLETANLSPSMIYYCCVLGCNNNSENNPNTFHSLPLVNQINNIKNVGDEKLQFLNKQLKICDEHFKQNNDTMTTQAMSLVIPSVYTKRANPQDFQEDSFILGSTDTPFAGSSPEDIIEEKVITTVENSTDQDLKYSIPMQDLEYVDVKTEEYYDLQNVCRICLSEDNLKQIETEYIDNHLICDMLRTCVNSESPVEDQLPKHICISCAAELKVMYDFLLKYKNTKTTLENYISKQQDINERRFYLQHGYINHSVNISDSMETFENSASSLSNTNIEEIKISNSVNSSKDLFNNVKVDNRTSAEKTTHKRSRQKDPLVLKSMPIEEWLDKEIVSRHVNASKPEIEAVDCQICNQTFRTPAGLKSHLVTHEEKNFNCTECLRKFSSEKRLELHMKCHSADRPYSCHLCGKTFICKTTLKNHVFIHTGQKPFLCKYCERGFVHLGQLRSHLKVHTGDRPYICKYCNKAFALNSNLTVHLRKHTGETPFVCIVCEKGFPNSSALKKHDRVHGLKL